MPIVSVIVPTYNQAQYISETIESVLNQTFKDIEIIVVDDGSTDQTKQVLTQYRDRIRYLRQINCGTPNALNTGIHMAEGKYIAICASDDVFMPHKIEMQIAKFFDDPDVGLVFSNAYTIDKTGNIIRHSIPNLDSKVLENPAIHLYAVNFIPCPTVMFQKKCLKKVGYFRPEYSPCDDYDLWSRIAQHFKLAYIDEPLAKHRVHTSSVSFQESDKAFSVHVQIVKTISDRFPEAKVLYPDRAPSLYLGLAKVSLIKGHFAKARSEIKQSLKDKPFSLRANLVLILAYLGRSGRLILYLLKKIKKEKHNVFLPSAARRKNI